MRSNQYYVAIDLGSNSFHMLIVRVVAHSLRIVAKIKQPVRLAEGLQEDGTLAAHVQERALECLALFADRVSDICPENIRAVGTATLRKLNPSDAFLAQMQDTLGHPIETISGEREAEIIYGGVSRTSSFYTQLLVCDIGGASTELAIGSYFQPQHTRSLDMGCVTWKSRFFPAGHICSDAVEQAIAAAERLIEPHLVHFTLTDKVRAVGASGTFKALQEIALHRQVSERFRLPWLQELQQECLAFNQLDQLQLEGLSPQRATVFLPGLCILIALFKQLQLSYLEITEAALREGLIYSMLNPPEHQDIQLQTLLSLSEHYQTDSQQAERVFHVYQKLSQAPHFKIALPKRAKRLARAVAYLHEIGQSLNYKHAGQHSYYLLKHRTLPGFSTRERAALLQLLKSVTGIIDDDQAPKSLPESNKLALLSRILRLSIICCQRRRDDAIPHCQLSFTNPTQTSPQATMNGKPSYQLSLQLPQGFFLNSPFLANLLQAESRFQQSFGGLLLTSE